MDQRFYCDLQSRYWIKSQLSINAAEVMFWLVWHMIHGAFCVFFANYNV
jgi:hypothetical protein